jgi:CMP-N-acetylneuraminic acid synthetase
MPLPFEDILALIPARGGSKGIPRKNIRVLAGHPLIAYSIAAGLQSRRVGRVVVSTDDEEIAGVARAYGAEVPFLRPAELARDESLDLPVVEHALAWLETNEGYRPDVVVQLRPTSPLRPVDLVDRGIERLESRPDADSARAVIPSRQNPFKMWREDQDGWITPLLNEGLDEPYNMPRQLLPPTFWQTGHLDVIRVTTIRNHHSLTGRRILPIHIDPRWAIDIDHPEDFERAGAIVAEAGGDLVTPLSRGVRQR